jgi:hypothetical protein
MESGFFKQTLEKKKGIRFCWNPQSVLSVLFHYPKSQAGHGEPPKLLVRNTCQQEFRMAYLKCLIIFKINDNVYSNKKDSHVITNEYQ